MSADKRSVATDALATLGTIIGPGEKRDAIHLAVEPVIAGEPLRPGEHITIKDGIATAAPDGEGLGIVDPFLTERVQRGQRFWFVMYPRQVHSLRHVWTHPAFPDSDGVSAPAESPKADAENWLKAYAATIPMHMSELLYAAGDWVENREYLVQGGRFEGYSVPDEFWVHYSAYTGCEVPADKRGSFFSCSC